MTSCSPSPSSRPSFRDHVSKPSLGLKAETLKSTSLLVASSAWLELSNRRLDPLQPTQLPALPLLLTPRSSSPHRQPWPPPPPPPLPPAASKSPPTTTASPPSKQACPRQWPAQEREPLSLRFRTRSASISRARWECSLGLGRRSASLRLRRVHMLSRTRRWLMRGNRMERLMLLLEGVPRGL